MDLATLEKTRNPNLCFLFHVQLRNFGNGIKSASIVEFFVGNIILCLNLVLTPIEVFKKLLKLFFL